MLLSFPSFANPLRLSVFLPLDIPPFSPLQCKGSLVPQFSGNARGALVCMQRAMPVCCFSALGNGYSDAVTKTAAHAPEWWFGVLE